MDKFDPRANVRFSTYAKWWIREAISRAILRKARTVRVPMNVQDIEAKHRRALRELAGKGREPTLEEVACHLSISRDRLAGALDAVAPQTYELDADRPAAASSTLDELVAVHERSAREALLEQLPAALASLSPEEARILRLRFGLDGKAPESMERIAVRMRMSVERSAIAFEGALRQLRRELSRIAQSN